MQVTDLVTVATLGGMYTILGISWVIVHQGTRILNFGTGQLMLMGALLLSTFASTRLPYPIALLGALIVAGCVTALLFLVLLRPLIGADAFSTAVLTIGVSIAGTAVMSILWGNGLRTLPKPIENTTHSFLGAKVGTYSIITLLVAILVVASLLYVLRNTHWGLRIRGSAEDPHLASLQGVNVTAMFAVVWFIAGVLAALGGISYATSSVVTPSIVDIGLRGIAPAMVGGFQSISGTAAGAFLVALIETVGVAYFGGGASNAMIFAALLVLIVVRPNGLFVGAEARRV